MHLIAFIDLITLICLIGAVVALSVFMHRCQSKDPVKIVAIGFLCCNILNLALLCLEWAFSIPIFDRLEDFIGTLMPMWWGVLFFSILEKIANRELALSQHRYQLVVDNIEELIIKLDAGNRIHFASPSFCALLEKPSEELIGRDFLSIMELEGNSTAFNFLDQAKRPPFLIESETPMETRQGSRWFAWNAKRVLEDHGNKKGTLVVGRDISDKKKAEQSLQESEARHRQFIENHPVGLFRVIIEGDGRFVMANPAMARIFGYPTVESFLKTPAIDLYRNPNHRQEILERLRNEGRIYGLEGEGKRRDNTLFYFSMSLQLNRDEQGNPMYTDGTIVDITARKQAEINLKKSEELHREAQRIAHLGHWERIIGDDFPIWSDEMYRIFELERSTSGLSMEDFFARVHPDDRANIEENIERAIKNRTAIDIVHRVLLPDKRIKYVHGIGHVEFDKDGNPVKVVGTVQDVTKLKEAELERERSEQKLLQAQKMEAIGTLAGGIAHDFNNILASIIGFTELSIAELAENKNAREYLDQVLQAGLRARDLVAHILSFSRQGENKREMIQVHIIIKEVAKFLRASIPANIEIKQKISAQCCPVLADPIQIHQIIMNLCTNSYHAIGNRQGHIIISLEEVEIGPHDFPGMPEVLVGSYVKLVVSDTGHGMDQVTLEKVFDPYFTTKKLGEGTGLGLAVVHGIVKKYDGQVTVYSEPGRGTSFCVYLPCAAGKEKIAHADSAAELLGGTEHIMVVDDEKPITDMLTGLLTRLGYRVTAFNDAAQVITFYHSHPDKIDLIITDMNMPTMNGEELAQSIHAIAPHVPVIIQTGYSEDLDLARLQRIGVKAIMKKPVLEREMSYCVRKVIDEKIE